MAKCIFSILTHKIPYTGNLNLYHQHLSCWSSCWLYLTCTSHQIYSTLSVLQELNIPNPAFLTFLWPWCSPHQEQSSSSSAIATLCLSVKALLPGSPSNHISELFYFFLNYFNNVINNFVIFSHHTSLTWWISHLFGKERLLLYLVSWNVHYRALWI